MIEVEQTRLDLLALIDKINELVKALRVNEAEKEADDLRQLTLNADFYNNRQESERVLKKIKQLENKLQTLKNIKASREDLLTLCELALSENDESVKDEIIQGAAELKDEIERVSLETLLNGKYDNCGVIITLHAGAGGTEAQDWVSMLFRMYQMYAEKHGFSCETLDFLDGEEAGLKSVSFLISGENAYGYLKSERGVHRLVRISPFDSNARRHTSFASADVMPDIEESIEVNINPDDLKIDTYRSSGAGGQHVNKTSSAVRITHIPTGVVAACQNERSQLQNKDTAMKMLKAKLAEIAEREHKEKIEDLKGVQMEIGWGSQIRSYVFQPYQMVKDHRTDFEDGNISAVMDGKLDGFINAYLRYNISN